MPLRASLLAIALGLLFACGDKAEDGQTDTSASDGSDGAVDVDSAERRDSADTTDSADVDGDGYTPADGDCDDTDALVNPGALEMPWDGLDNDCDGGRAHPAAAVSVGRHHACALDPDGTAHCWGLGLDGQASAPSGAFSLIVAGPHATCALDAAGELTCWGRVAEAQYRSLNEQAADATGDRSLSHVFWVGTELCGSDASGGTHCNGPVAGTYGPFAPPAISGHYAVGQWLFVSPEGELGGLGASGLYDTSACSAVGGREPGDFRTGTVPIAAIDGGRDSQCVIDTDGGVHCWGCLGGAPASPPTGAFLSFSVGDQHACALDAAGAITCWGDDSAGQSSPPAGAFSSVDAGGDTTCAVRADGEAVCWGDDAALQATVP